MPLMSRPPLNQTRPRERVWSDWRRRKRPRVARAYSYGQRYTLDAEVEPSFRQELDESEVQTRATATDLPEVAAEVWLSDSAATKLASANAYIQGYMDFFARWTDRTSAQLPPVELSHPLPVPSATRAPATVVRVHDFELPAAIGHLSSDIERSRSLLELADDWDDAGSPAYTEETWRRAVDLMVRIATHTWEDHRVRVDSVDIVPGANGRIGLEWRAPGHELLINVPADPAEEAIYYGDDGNGGNRQKGSFRIERPNRWLSTWLAE